MKNEAKISLELREIASKLVKEYNMPWLELENIEFVQRDKSSKALADIRKVGYPATLYTSKTIVITAYQDFSDLNEEKKKIVILHELFHISPEDSGKLLKHDFEEFRVIFEKYGDWQSENK